MTNDSLAQLVEQLTLNQRVQSSSLWRVTKRLDFIIKALFYFAYVHSPKIGKLTYFCGVKISEENAFSRKREQPNFRLTAHGASI